MSIDVCLDVSFFSWKKESEKINDESFEEYIKKIQAAASHLGSHIVKIFCSDVIKRVLYDEGKYPFHETIKVALRDSGLADIYQPSDIAEILNRLVEFSFTLEDKLNIDQVLTEIRKSNIPFSSLNSEAIRQAQEEQAVLAGIAQRCAAAFEEGCTFVGMVESLESQGRNDLSVDAIVHEIDSRSSELLLQPPFDLALSGTAYECTTTLLKDSDLRELVARHVYDCSEFDDAMMLLLTALCPKAKYSGKLGRDFFHSIDALHVTRNRTLLFSLIDCMKAVLNRENEDQCHRLRTGAGGNDPPRTQGNAVAWRRDIDREFHLHYWILGSDIEFASVVVHNDFSIPRCSLT